MIMNFEDSWTQQKVGTPFPQHAVRVLGQSNKYVALWYQHGQPVNGEAWNDCGVVQCHFACDQKVVKGTAEMNIQLLIYEGDHVTKKFFYEWIELGKFKERPGVYEMVHCGDFAPIYSPLVKQVGNYNTKTKKAQFVENEKWIEVTDPKDIAICSIIVKNTEGGPTNCPCKECGSKRDVSKMAMVQSPLRVNDWGDFISGKAWPPEKLVKAMNRELNTKSGPKEEFVALWYRHGKPCMGKAAKDKNNLIEAAFVNDGRIFSGPTLGSMQILVEMPSTVVGFEYIWLPYKEAKNFHGQDYAPVHIDYVAPCVLMDDKYEVLGQVNMNVEKAEAVCEGKVWRFDGPKLSEFKVLCRRDTNDTFTI